MSEWSEASAIINEEILGAFGETVSYFPGIGVPQTLVVVRGMRDRLETDALASFERIWARVSDFPAYPAPGDTVSFGDVAVADQAPEVYTVHSVKVDADPSSTGITVYLARQ